jgi:hypothetical protein
MLVAVVVELILLALVLVVKLAQVPQAVAVAALEVLAQEARLDLPIQVVAEAVLVILMQADLLAVLAALVL